MHVAVYGRQSSISRLIAHRRGAGKRDKGEQLVKSVFSYLHRCFGLRPKDHEGIHHQDNIMHPTAGRDATVRN